MEFLEWEIFVQLFLKIAPTCEHLYMYMLQPLLCDSGVQPNEQGE